MVTAEVYDSETLLDSSNTLVNMHSRLTKFACSGFAVQYWTAVLSFLLGWNRTGDSLIFYVSRVPFSLKIDVLNRWHLVCLQNTTGASACTSCQPGDARLCCNNHSTCANNGHHSLHLNYIELALTYTLHATGQYQSKTGQSTCVSCPQGNYQVCPPNVSFGHWMIK